MTLWPVATGRDVVQGPAQGGKVVVLWQPLPYSECHALLPVLYYISNLARALANSGVCKIIGVAPDGVRVLWFRFIAATAVSTALVV